jgi:hypothetical protein
LAQIFPEWTNKLPPIVIVNIVAGAVTLISLVWYFGSPEYTDVGYRPVQPVPYSHKFHAGDLGLDCRYCHTSVEVSSVSIIPPTNTCMNCHSLIKTESEKLAPVRESFNTGTPLEWIKVHNLPDFVYFNHSVHVSAGVGCISCHGNIAEMEVVIQEEPLSMGWCLECHRDPALNLRPIEEVTNMRWTPPANQAAIGAQLMLDRNINPPEDCTACHR